MSTTVNALQLDLAYRLGERAAPSSIEESRRLSFINQAYRAVMREHYWWFTETESTFNSVADQPFYTPGSNGFPTDIRNMAILEVRYDGTLISPLTQTQALQCMTQGYSNYSDSYFMFNSKLYPVAPFTSTDTDNCSIKYYKNSTPLTSGSDTVLLPDMYADVLNAYAYARMAQTRSKRGSAADGFDEFNEIMRQMRIEQNNYLFALKSSGVDVLEAQYE